jgi:competence protein ComEA
MAALVFPERNMRKPAVKFALTALLSVFLMQPALAQAPMPHAGPMARTSPAPATKPSTTATPAAGALVDVNSADAAALDALPGVGPARAKAIIAGRPWTDKQDLVTRKAIPANVLANVQGMIALVNVNTASAADMAKILPNVGAVRSAAIVKNRPYAAAQDLVAKGALTQGVFDGIKGMITTN